jgi:hypothetical protein
MPDFQDTPTGRKFFGHQIPELLRHLDAIADQLAEVNETLQKLIPEQKEALDDKQD